MTCLHALSDNPFHFYNKKKKGLILKSDIAGNLNNFSFQSLNNRINSICITIFYLF